METMYDYMTLKSTLIETRASQGGRELLTSRRDSPAAATAHEGSSYPLAARGVEEKCDCIFIEESNAGYQRCL